MIIHILATELRNSSEVILGDNEEDRNKLLDDLLLKLDTNLVSWMNNGPMQLQSGFYNSLVKRLSDKSNKKEFMLLRMLSENNKMVFDEAKNKHGNLISNFLTSNFKENYYNTKLGKYETAKSSKERSIYEALTPKDMDVNLRREVVDIKRKFGSSEISNSDVEKIKAIKAFSKNINTAKMMLGTKGFNDALFHISDLEPITVQNYMSFVNCLTKNEKIAIGFSEEDWNAKISATFVPTQESFPPYLTPMFYCFAYSAFRYGTLYTPRWGDNYFTKMAVAKHVGISMVSFVAFMGFTYILRDNNIIDHSHLSNSAKALSLGAALYSLYKFAPYSVGPAVTYYLLQEGSPKDLYKNFVGMIKKDSE